MNRHIISKRYAISALHQIPSEQYEVLLKDTYAIRRVFRDNKDLMKILKSKIIHPRKKLELLDALVEKSEIRHFWEFFFEILTAKKRESFLPTIVDELIRHIYLFHDKVLVDLELAFETETATLDKIRTFIEKQISHRVEFEIRINPSILGGFIARTEDRVIDASIFNSLNQFVNKSLSINL